MITGAERATAVLFDKDGTLLDFHKTWGKLGEEVILTLSAGEPELTRRLADLAGFDLATGTYAPGAPIVAGAVDELVSAWLPHLTQWRRAELESWLNMQAATISKRGLVAASRDIVGLMRRLRGAGLKIGLATHDAEDPARLHLDHLGVADAFDFVAGYDSGFAPKPSDAMLRGFCDVAGVAAETVVVVGDSVHDLGMGRSGGALACVGVLTGPAARRDLEAAADIVLPSIDDLPRALRLPNPT